MFYKKKKNQFIFYIFFFIIFLFLIKFSTNNALAKTYKIKDIEVSQSFETNFKKLEIIDEAIYKAFIELIFKITLSKDQNKLKKINSSKIKQLVDSFTITDERFIEDKYYANFDVDFEKKEVFRFLEEKNIFPSILDEKTLLILPILYDINANEVFFFNKNEFYNNWNIKNEKYYLLNYVLPNEDIEDISFIKSNIDNIEDYDFLEIISKYNLKDYIITIFFKTEEKIRCLSKVNLNNKLVILNKEFINLNLKEESDMSKMIEDLKIDYEDQWKKINQINTSIKLPLTLHLESKNTELILRLTEVLDNLDLVSKHYIDRFSSSSIVYKIIYSSTPDKFISEIESNGFKIDSSKKNWKIK